MVQLVSLLVLLHPIPVDACSPMTEPLPGLQGVESILKALGIGGSATAPVARSANAPASSPAQIAPQILSSLQGQNTAGWNANQVKAFIQKVVAQSNGAVTPEQAMQILEMSKKGN